jgi:hypothetical protein
MARAMLRGLPMVRWLEQWGRTVLCLVALAVLVPLTASAQTCPNVSLSLPTGIVNRYYPGGDVAKNLFPTRPQNLQPTWINYADCAADIHLQFTLAASGLPCADLVQVWAGPTDCTQLSARQTTSSGARCWQVAPPVTIAQSFEVDVRVRDVVAYISTEEPPVEYTFQDSAASCESQSAPGGTALGIYFMAMEASGQAVDGTSAEYGTVTSCSSSGSGTTGSTSFGADLVGPYAPTSVTAGIGENLIIVNWTPATDSTIQGYNIYCQDQGGAGPDSSTEASGPTLICPDSGVSTVFDAATDTTSTVTNASDAGCYYVNLADSGGGGGSNCVSNVLTNVFVTSPTGTTSEGGVIAVADSSTGDSSVASLDVGISNIPNMYLCGQVGGNTTSSYVVTNYEDCGPPIHDFHNYAVAVAAFDGTGNTGIISNLSCVVPEPVIDFWTAYTNAGGAAGGGFCALQGAGMPVGTSVFGVATAGIAIGLIRRRRRRRRACK